MVIALDTLVDLLVVDWDNYVETTTDLPDGSYYVKELYVSFPYVLSTDVVEFTLSYNGDGVTPKLVVEGEELVNAPDTGYARFIKLSKSIDDGLVTNGSEYNTEGLDAKAKQIVDEIKSMSREDMLAYFEQAKVKFVEGAEYEIWLDEEGTNKLQEVDLQTGDLKVATFRTDDLGIIELFELPKGAFYLKETKVPAGYEIQNDVVPFEIKDSIFLVYSRICKGLNELSCVSSTELYCMKSTPSGSFVVILRFLASSLPVFVAEIVYFKMSPSCTWPPFEIVSPVASFTIDVLSWTFGTSPVVIPTGFAATKFLDTPWTAWLS